MFPDISLPLNQFLKHKARCCLRQCKNSFLNLSAHDSLLGRSDDVPLRSPRCVCRHCWEWNDASQSDTWPGGSPFPRQSALEGCPPLASVLIILPQQQSCGYCPKKDALHAVLMWRLMWIRKGSERERSAFLSAYCVQAPLSIYNTVTVDLKKRV